VSDDARPSLVADGAEGDAQMGYVPMSEWIEDFERRQ
jgi:hypothetical protein